MSIPPQKGNNYTDHVLVKAKAKVSLNLSVPNSAYIKMLFAGKKRLCLGDTFGCVSLLDTLAVPFSPDYSRLKSNYAIKRVVNCEGNLDTKSVFGQCLGQTD